MLNDTIVAVATAEGSGGVAMVRLSGPESVEISRCVFQPDFGLQPQSHKAVYGILSWPLLKNNAKPNETGPIDQVIALPMLGTKSYTGEDTVEFFCHGGTVVTRMVVSALRLAGARPAAAGEFSRRAFLNGKMSLDQAEAVADLIHAESEMSARGAISQLLGGLNSQLSSIEKPLLQLLAELEGGLEFLEEDHAGVDSAQIGRLLSQSIGGISTLLDLAPAGKLLRDGVQVVLLGPPNVGKSSLFNELVGSDRAIVDDEAGTTRDIVTERTVRDGQVFVFHDTAGIRDAAGRVENLGMQRTHKAVQDADIVLSLSSFESADISEEITASNAALISVITKCDLNHKSGSSSGSENGPIYTSSATGEGVDFLWKRIENSVQKYQLDKAISLGVVINERHRFKLEKSMRELEDLLAEVSNPDSFCGNEVTGTLLASILAQLGEISGRVFSEQVLESVFSRFCVGK